MSPIRETILCAALARDADRQALEMLQRSVAHGRLLHRMGDRILVRYATPDAAAGAAAGMAAGIGPRARIAFHCPAPGDEVIARVMELVAQAQPGQVLTTRSTAELLGTSFRAFSRALHAAPLAAANGSVYEILGSDAG